MQNLNKIAIPGYRKKCKAHYNFMSYDNDILSGISHCTSKIRVIGK